MARASARFEAFRLRAVAVLGRVAAVLGLAGLTAAGAAGADAPAFRRGINMADYFAYPASSEWPLFTGPRAATGEAELARLKSAGFDFIRLPVEPGPFLDRSPGEVAELEKRLMAFLARAERAGLAVIVTGFARHETPRWNTADITAGITGEAYLRYAGFLERLARLLAGRSVSRQALALMNEPQPECRRTRGPDWTEVQRDLYARVRKAAPELTLVLTGGCWSGRDGLAHLDLAGYDARTLVDVHFYEPFTFTHQSATWTLPELRSLAGVAFPAAATRKAEATAASARLFAHRFPAGRPADLVPTLRKLDAYIRENASEATIAAAIAGIGQWADRQRLPRHRLLIGEFGTLRPPPEAAAADEASRGRWLAAVRKAAERQGFGWALWAYHSPFGLVTDDARPAPDPGMLKALGLAER